LEAPLIAFEEAALRKIGFGNTDILEPVRVKRLVTAGAENLTAVGRQRYSTLVVEDQGGMQTPGN